MASEQILEEDLDDYRPMIKKGDNFDVVNDGPEGEAIRDEWVQAPVQMGGDGLQDGEQLFDPTLHSWEEFDSRFKGRPLT